MNHASKKKATMVEGRIGFVLALALTVVLVVATPAGVSDMHARGSAPVYNPTHNSGGNAGVSELTIVEIAEQYLGTPYRYGGTTPAGFDCSGLTGYVYKKAGINLPRQTDAQYVALDPVRVPQPGDLIFFRIDGQKVSHVGIYAGDFQFIHAPSSGKSVSYADIRNPYWKARYAGSRSANNR